MSVLQQLKNTAGEPSGLTRVDGGNAQGSELMLAMEANPIPGQSLTQDPDNRQPWETPPEFTDVQVFVDEAFLEISDPMKLPDLLEAMRAEIPVEYLTEQYLMRKVAEGKINPDLMMLSVEPVIYILLHFAAYANIDAVLYPEDDMMHDEEFQENTSEFRKATKDLMAHDDNGDGKISAVEMQAPTVVPKSLLARTEEAVNQVEGGPDASDRLQPV